MSNGPWEARHRETAACLRIKCYDEDGVVEKPRRRRRNEKPH